MVEDLHQEILFKIHKARHTYDPAKPFAPWLGSVTRNTIFDYLRRKRSDSRLETLQEESNLPTSAFSLDETIFLHDAMARLSEAHRSAIELVQIQGLSMAEAAAKLGISSDAMKTRASRAYKALQELLLAEDKEST